MRPLLHHDSRGIYILWKLYLLPFSLSYFPPSHRLTKRGKNLRKICNLKIIFGLRDIIVCYGLLSPNFDIFNLILEKNLNASLLLKFVLWLSTSIYNFLTIKGRNQTDLDLPRELNKNFVFSYKEGNSFHLAKTLHWLVGCFMEPVPNFMMEAKRQWWAVCISLWQKYTYKHNLCQV